MPFAGPDTPRSSEECPSEKREAEVRRRRPHHSRQNPPYLTPVPRPRSTETKAATPAPSSRQTGKPASRGPEHPGKGPGRGGARRPRRCARAPSPVAAVVDTGFPRRAGRLVGGRCGCDRHSGDLLLHGGLGRRTSLRRSDRTSPRAGFGEKLGYSSSALYSRDEVGGARSRGCCSLAVDPGMGGRSRGGAGSSVYARGTPTGRWAELEVDGRAQDGPPQGRWECWLRWAESGWMLGLVQGGWSQGIVGPSRVEGAA